MSIPYKLPQNEAQKRRRNALIDSNKDDEKIANYQYDEEENGEYSDGEFIDDYDHVFSDELLMMMKKKIILIFIIRLK